MPAMLLFCQETSNWEERLDAKFCNTHSSPCCSSFQNFVRYVCNNETMKILSFVSSSFVLYVCDCNVIRIQSFAHAIHPQCHPCSVTVALHWFISPKSQSVWRNCSHSSGRIRSPGYPRGPFGYPPPQAAFIVIAACAKTHSLCCSCGTLC
jgi:hypothetical protein